MKLCIPVASGEGLAAPLFGDFGAARHLLIIDGEQVHALDRAQPETISEALVCGIGGILCNEIHPRLLVELQRNGIAVFGCEAATAAEALESFRAGELEPVPVFNPHEHAHDHDHGHGAGGCGCASGEGGGCCGGGHGKGGHGACGCGG